MKIFSFIFSIYFFALAILPCGDKAECERSSPLTFIQSQDHSDHQHKNEICSPLCMCSCCGGVTIVSNSNNNLIAQISTEQLSIYNPNSPFEISFSIWQPPKV